MPRYAPYHAHVVDDVRWSGQFATHHNCRDFRRPWILQYVPDHRLEVGLGATLRSLFLDLRDIVVREGDRHAE